MPNIVKEGLEIAPADLEKLTIAVLKEFCTGQHTIDFSNYYNGDNLLAEITCILLAVSYDPTAIYFHNYSLINFPDENDPFLRKARY